MSQQERDPGTASTCKGDAVDPRLVLAVVMAGTFLAPLDSSIVNIALPAISAELGARLTAVGWVATAYLLTNAALVLTMGRLADLWGLRRVYSLGFVVFGAGSAACAASGTLGLLVGSRVLQATGAAMIFAAGPAIITLAFPPERRGRALGMVGLSVSAGLTAGPPLGGLLVGAFGWPSIFLINVPLSIGAAVIAWRRLPDECPVAEPFDLRGAVLFALALLPLLLALSEADRLGWTSLPVLGMVALAVVSAALFVKSQMATAHPMLDLRLFSTVPFAAGIAAAVMGFMSLFTVTFTMPFYLLKVRGLDSQAAGLVLMATPLTMALFAPVSGRLADRVGSRGPATAGMAWCALSVAGMSLLGPQTPIALVALGLACIGAGVSFFQTPNTTAVLNATPPSRRGVGSALVGEARSVGMTLGIALTAAVVTAGLGGADLLSAVRPLALAERALVADAMGSAMLVGGGIALIAAFVSWRR